MTQKAVNWILVICALLGLVGGAVGVLNGIYTRLGNDESDIHVLQQSVADHKVVDDTTDRRVDRLEQEMDRIRYGRRR